MSHEEINMLGTALLFMITSVIFILLAIVGLIKKIPIDRVKFYFSIGGGFLMVAWLFKLAAGF